MRRVSFSVPDGKGEVGKIAAEAPSWGTALFAGSTQSILSTFARATASVYNTHEFITDEWLPFLCHVDTTRRPLLISAILDLPLAGSEFKVVT